MANRMRLERPCIVFVGLVLLSTSLSGCTLVGAGVGAGIDSAIPGPYEERVPAERVRLERRDRIVVRRQNGTRVTGRYVGMHGPTTLDPESYLLVDAGETVTSVKVSEVCSIAVEVTGKGWLYGGLIGLAVDTVVVVAAAIAVQNMQLGGNLSSRCCY